jgi:hypothetical protein
LPDFQRFDSKDEEKCETNDIENGVLSWCGNTHWGMNGAVADKIEIPERESCFIDSHAQFSRIAIMAAHQWSSFESYSKAGFRE